MDLHLNLSPPRTGVALEGQEVVSESERPGGLPLQYSQGIVQAFRIGLAAQKVPVFGHQDVAEKKKLMTADGVKDAGEYSSRVIVLEIGETVITTEGEKVRRWSRPSAWCCFRWLGTIRRNDLTPLMRKKRA